MDTTGKCTFQSCSKNGLSRCCLFCNKLYCSQHEKIWDHFCDLHELDSIEDKLCNGCRCMRKTIEEIPDRIEGIRHRERELDVQNHEMNSRIHELGGQLFDLNQELARAQADSHRLLEVKEENLHLAKKVFTLEEICQKFQERLASLTNHSQSRLDTSSKNQSPPHLYIKIQCLERELEKEKTNADCVTRERDYYKAKLEEQDAMQKDNEMENKLTIQRYQKRRQADHELIVGLKNTNDLLKKKILELNRNYGTTPTDNPQRILHLDAEENELNHSGGNED